MPAENRIKPDGRETVALILTGIFILVWTLFRSKTELQWDEGRYLAYARNLLQGKYASEETLYLWNGPGFPILIALTQFLHLPLLSVKILNAAFLMGTLWYFRICLTAFKTPRPGYWSAGLGIFLVAHGALPELLMSESLSVFLVMGSIHHAIRYFREGKPSQGAWAAFFLGWLALTKVFFGYVLPAGVVLSLAWWVWRRGLGLKGAAVCAGALAVTIPYLIYTHALTGKIFYWGNSGGAQLYCMTLPENRFLGDWLNSDAVMGQAEFFGPHSDFYRRLDTLDFVSRDAELKSAALKNIREHPAKYFKNWRANVNRMVFGYPVTAYPGAAPQLATGNRSFIYALPFMLILFAIPFAVRRRFTPEMKALTVFLVISLAGLSLLSAVPRQVFPLLPVVWFWILFVIKNPEPAQA